MVKLGSASEHDMVLAFLRAEIESPRFGRIYAEILATTGLDRARLIEEADLANPADNEARIQLLQAVRGYRANQYLFQGFPGDVSWRQVAVDAGELGRVQYANYPTWTQLSGGTRLVADGARNVDRVHVGENANANIKAIAAAVRSGRKYPELIAVEDEQRALILVEGHARATAYLLADLAVPITILVGSSPRMKYWAFY